MNICSEGHEEICYEGRCCPLCDLKDELDGNKAVFCNKCLTDFMNYQKQIADKDKLIEDMVKSIVGLIPLAECSTQEHSNIISFAGDTLAACEKYKKNNPRTIDPSNPDFQAFQNAERIPK